MLSFPLLRCAQLVIYFVFLSFSRSSHSVINVCLKSMTLRLDIHVMNSIIPKTYAYPVCNYLQDHVHMLLHWNFSSTDARSSSKSDWSFSAEWHENTPDTILSRGP